MNLNTVTEVRRVTGDEGPDWREGDGWLAGGTWLFSEPQPHLRRLLDLHGFSWEPLMVGEQGLQIFPTCTIAQLDALEAPREWKAAPLFQECCNAFLASFKVWNTATVGGSICMSLPAGPMISLAVALEGVYTLRLRDGSERRVAADEFVTGDHQNILQPGDLLCSIYLPIAALRKQTSFRRISLTHLGRSTALLIGTLSPQDGTFMLTVSASTKRPVRLSFDRVPDARSLRDRLREAIADSMYHDDVHGAPDYRKHMTYHFADFADTPRTEVLFADTWDAVGPLGAKGMGECPVNPVAGALANALADATGVRFYDLPFTPDRIYRRIFERHVV